MRTLNINSINDLQKRKKNQSLSNTTEGGLNDKKYKTGGKIKHTEMRQKFIECEMG
jgi:hypothetical protein